MLLARDAEMGNMRVTLYFTVRWTETAFAQFRQGRLGAIPGFDLVAGQGQPHVRQAFER